MKINVLLSMAAAACAMDCAQATTPPTTPCSADFATTGAYRNFNFGFTLTIPKGLKATWSSPPCSVDPVAGDCVCMNDHGRDIELPGGGTVHIEAEHNVLDWTLPTIAFQDLDGFKGADSGTELSVVQLERARWKGMPAYRYVARRDTAGEAVVRESVLATTRHGADMVIVAIEAPESQYLKYRRAFQEMLRSWRASPIQ